MGYAFSALATPPCTTVLISQNSLPLACSVKDSLTILVRVNNIPSGLSYLNSIAIRDVPNPNIARGTGLFSMRILKGNLNEYDYNYFFAQIGYSLPYSPATANLVLQGNMEPNQVGQFKLTFTVATAITIPEGGTIRIRIPRSSPGLVIDNAKIKVTPDQDLINDPPLAVPPNVPLRFYKDYIILHGLKKRTGITNLEFLIDGIQNLPYGGPTPAFEVDVRANGVEHVIAKAISGAATVNYGQITAANIYMTSFDVDVTTIKPNIGDTVNYEVSFKIKNTLPDNCAISLNYDSTAGFTMVDCWAMTSMVDLSETSKIACDFTTNPGEIRYTNLRGIYKGKLVKIGFRATNPSTYSAPTGSFRVNTCYLADCTKLVDQSILINLQLSDTHLAPTLTMPTTVQSNKVSTSMTISAVMTASVGSFGLKVYLAPGFTNTNTPSNVITCVLKKNTVAVAGVTCTAIVNDKNFLEVSFSPATLTSAAAGDIIDVTFTPPSAGKGIKAPLYAGKYFGQMIFVDASNVVQNVGTGYMDVQSIALTPAIFGTYTRDMGHKTVMDFSVYLPYSVEQGQWTPEDDSGITFFEVLFTPASFPNLVQDYPNAATSLPCYGITVLKKYLTANDNLLTCFYTLSTDKIITVKGYDKVDTPGMVRFHLPGLYNYPTNTYAAPATSGSASGVLVTVNLYRYYRQKKILLASATSDLYPKGVAPIDIFDNPRNFAGPLGTSTNISPTFVPNTISQPSYIELKFTPTRKDSFELSKGGGLYLFVPSLPVTNPQYYILPPQGSVACKIKYTYISCYSYPEANMLVIEQMPKIVANNEIIIRITGFTNPPYVEDLHKPVLVWSFDNLFKEVEQFKYPDLPPLDYGPVNDAYVLPYNYQALKQGVTYDWVFRLADDLPEGGKLILYYPANYYDLQSSSPCPSVELVQGIEWIDPANSPSATMARTFDCSIMYATSIVTVDQIKRVKKDAVIVIRFKGVKNPSQEGWTPYFQIESKTSAGSTIDRIQTIKQVYITRKFDVNTIVFDNFYTTPDNGLLLGNYYLSFYPQNPIPQFGLIQITMPTAEFDPTTDWPAASKQFCFVGGSLKTYKNCTWKTTQPIIEIYIDEALTIEPGMEPVRIMLPHIMNFNAELSSGVVKVTTSFDGLVIDESGTDESNRKATTSKTAALLASCSVAYEPKNEGNVARYTFTFTSKIGVDKSAVIQFEFPYEFPKKLGTNIVCTNIVSTGLQDIRISTLDPLSCVVSDWKINVTNHNGWTATTATPVTIKIEVYGVINPNSLPAITDQIAVWIFKSPATVSEYYQATGALTYTSAPEPLLEYSATITPDEPRKLTNSKHNLWSTATLPYTRTNVHFPIGYDVPVTSPNLNIKSRSAATLTPVTYYNNSVTLMQGSTTPPQMMTPEDFELDQLSTPYDMGFHPLYIFEFENTPTQNVVAKTYPNLINRNPTNYQTTDKIITINKEQYLYLGAGTYSDAIPIESPVAPAQDVVITATASDPALVFSPSNIFTLPAGSKISYFRVGYDLFSLTRTIVVTFQITSGQMNNGGVNFAKIKAIRVVVQPTTSVDVKITEMAALAAGGRSVPLAFYLDKGPFKQLTVGIYQIGRIPDMLGIYPSELVFQPGEKKKFFWLSTDYASKGSEGSVVFTLTGLTKSVYNFANRQKEFFIYQGRDTQPVILDTKIVGPCVNNSILVYIKTDSHCTAYFAVYPRGTLDATFTEIRRKRLRYDNFQGKYKLGEYVDSNTDNIIFFEINNIEPGLEQVLKIFVQNTDGVLSEAIIYPFTTLRPEAPMKIYLSSSTDSISSAVLAQLQAGMGGLAGRLTSSVPDTTKYFEQKQIGEADAVIPYPENNMNGALQDKKNKFIQSKNKIDQQVTTSTTSSVLTALTLMLGSSANNYNKSLGVGDIEALVKANQKRQTLNGYVDEGEEKVVYDSNTDTMIKYKTKEVVPLLKGQEASTQEQ